MTTLRAPNYGSPRKWAQFADVLPGRLRSVPGVEAVGAVSSLPLAGTGGWSGIEVEGFSHRPGQPEMQSDQRCAVANYFETLRIPLIQGRYFNDRDTPRSAPVAIIDEAMARRFWPNGSALGKRLRVTGRKTNPWLEIVGVVGLVKQYGLDLDTRMVVYFPQSQFPVPTLYIVARTKSDPASAVPAIERAIHSIDPMLPVYGVHTMKERLSRSLARQRFATSMLGAFAAFALILAVLGIYGVVSYLVTQTTHDIGVRIALGALPRDILGLVVGHGMTLAAVGLGSGIVGALALTRLIQSLLFGVNSSDAVTFTIVAILLALVTFIASFIPAVRAARLDPTAALREE